MSKKGYVIWSFEHNAWWGPDKCGYTRDIQEAGRYSATDAGRIVVNSIFLDELAIHESVLARWGYCPPSYHPYGGPCGTALRSEEER